MWADKALKKLLLLLALVLLCGCSQEVAPRDPDAIYWIAEVEEKTLTVICDGREEVLTIKEPDLAAAVAPQDACGLRFDEKGRVTAVLTLDQMPYSKAGWMYYVRRADHTALVLNSSLILAGEEQVLLRTGAEKCYDMTAGGAEAEPRAGDRVCCATIWIITTKKISPRSISSSIPIWNMCISGRRMWRCRRPWSRSCTATDRMYRALCRPRCLKCFNFIRNSHRLGGAFPPGGCCVFLWQDPWGKCKILADTLAN